MFFGKRQTEEELIKELHNEFDSAPERLLKEALAIISQNEKIKVGVESSLEDKAKRLKRLGFNSTDVVLKLNEIKNRNEQKDQVIQEETEKAKIFEFYNKRFPECKFLPEDEFNRICHKYGLVYAPVEHYTQTVPDENLEEIENNTPHISKDIAPKGIYYVHYKIYDYKHDNYVTPEESKNWENPLMIESDFEPSAPRWVIRQMLQEKYNTTKEIHLSPGVTMDIVDKSGLFIAAPKNHFNTENLTFDGKYGFFTLNRKIIKTDPVVFKYVKGGLLIISKWGIVGKDPLLNL